MTLIALCYKLPETLWGSLVSCGRLSIGPLPRSQPNGGGNQPPRRLSTCPTSMAHAICSTVIPICNGNVNSRQRLTGTIFVRKGDLMTKFKRITLLFGGFLLAGLLHAQFENAEVLGTVRDQSGGTVPKAMVTLTNQDTGIKVQTSTDENGNFDFFNVKVGRYALVVEDAGFSKATTTDVMVNVGARQRVDVAMQVGAVSESVEVTSVAAALETDSSEHGQVINTAAVTELPLNGRNYADLALLSTNAVKSPISATFSPSGTPREGAFNVNGMRSTYNNFLLDGLDNNSYGTSNQGYSAQLVQLSPDALAEFKVITSNYSAEFGRVGGAVVSAVMKSGTNQFHATAYEYLRNTALNATGFLFSPAVFVKPTLQRNQFGATIGGPIVKNKLFFFGDYEGYRQLQRYL